MDERTVIDRTTRFIVTLTLFGGAWYLLKGVTSLWVNTFSEVLYSNSIISDEHIFSMSLLIIMLSITGAVIAYLFSEYKTYKKYEDTQKFKDAIQKADESFNGIFSMIEVSFFSILTLFFLIFFIKEVKILTFLALVLVGLLSGLVYHFYLKQKVNNLLFNRISININTKVKQVVIITFITLMILILSLSLMVVSFGGSQKVEVEIKETNKIPIEISLMNFESPTIKLNIYRDQKPNNNIELDISKDDLQSSLLKVYETNIPKENFILKGNIDNKMPLSKNESYYLYTSELSKYILEGKNVLELIIVSESFTDIKTVRIATTITKEGKEIIIPQKNYEVRP